MTDSAPVVERIIRERRTIKVFSETPLETESDPRVVDELIECAGWAPFHRPAAAVHLTGEDLPSIVPWRFHALDAPTCRRVREMLLEQGDTSKMPRMLATAMNLIQVTWLPDPVAEPGEAPFAPTVANMEHIAATAAAIQNLLLAATARGVPTYWSSGGVLRKPEWVAWLGIPEREILLGSVFLFSPDLDGLEHVTGKLREKRGTPKEWARWVTLRRETA